MGLLEKMLLPRFLLGRVGLVGNNRDSCEPLIGFRYFQQTRGLKKHKGDRYLIERGQVYAKTMLINKENNLMNAYNKINTILREDGYYDKVKEYMYYEKPTDKRRRLRKEARWNRYLDYVRAQVYASEKYYEREKSLSKHENSQI